MNFLPNALEKLLKVPSFYVQKLWWEFEVKNKKNHGKDNKKKLWKPTTKV